MNKALLIFAKKPELGKVKTRLAADIGDKKALGIYQQLLTYTFNVANKIETHIIACFTEEDKPTLDRLPHDSFYKQEQGDLGHKMHKAFEYSFSKGFDKTVIIGTDCPDLTHEILEEAYRKLDAHDVVIGPAKDGGYYLIAMKTSKPYLFQNKEWSTEKVLIQTIQSIKENSLTFYLLQELNDIDTVEDLASSSIYNI